VSAKRRQTFEKRNRERALLDKRARKQEKKEQRKLAAQAPENGDGSAASTDEPQSSVE